MFTRLYFFKGHGLKHFKLLDYERQITGEEIFTYKVDWEGNNKEIAFGKNESDKNKEAVNTEKANQSKEPVNTGDKANASSENTTSAETAGNNSNEKEFEIKI
jgi:hypothetical protein